MKLKKIIRQMKFLLQKPSPEKVFFVNFAVTYLCNSQCRHCNIWKRYKKNPEEIHKELKLEEIKSFFNQSQYLRHLRSISLTGGEPFLRKDLEELCVFFIKKYPNIYITIPTNAVNPNLILNKLEKIGKLTNRIYISISLDGIGKTHDEIRGIPGNFSRVLKLIELIKKRLPSINQGISFTITPQNYKDLLKVYKLSRKLDVNFSVQLAQISSSFYGNIDKQFGFADSELGELEKIITAIEKEERKKKNFLQKIWDSNAYYLLHMVKFKKKPMDVSKHFKCYSGIHSCFIDPFGNIYPCIMLNKKIGNIRDSDFDTIWMSEKAKEVRRFISEKKCMCWTPCEAIQSLSRQYLRVMLWNFKKIFLKKI